MESLSFAGIQADLRWESIDQNLASFSERIHKLEKQVDVIVLPEMFTTGFSMKTELAERMEGKSMQWMANEASKTSSVITGSLIIKEESDFYNRLIWMRPDGDYSFYNKRHLFGLGGEDLHYSAGAERKIIEYKSWRINLNICYDLRFPVWSRNNDDYDILLNVANWPEKRIVHWSSLLKARAIENLCYVIGINRYGTDGNELYHSGNSAIINPMGELMVEAVDKEFSLFGTCNKEDLVSHRKRFGFLRDRDHFSIVQ